MIIIEDIEFVQKGAASNSQHINQKGNEYTVYNEGNYCLFANHDGSLFGGSKLLGKVIDPFKFGGCVCTYHDKINGDWYHTAYERIEDIKRLRIPAEFLMAFMI